MRGRPWRPLRRARARAGEQLHNFGLHQTQVRGGLQRVLHQRLVGPPVGLHPLALHGGPFTRVERAGLQRDLVGRVAHLAPQRVNFIHQVPLGRAADRGIAGHVCHRVQRQGEQHRVHPHAGGGQSGLNSGVPGADNGNPGLHCIRHMLRSPFDGFDVRHGRARRRRRRFFNRRFPNAGASSGFRGVRSDPIVCPMPDRYCASEAHPGAFPQGLPPVLRRGFAHPRYPQYFRSRARSWMASAT